MPPTNNRKRQKVFRRFGFALSNFWTTMYYTGTKLGKKPPKTFCRTQSKNFHAKVWKVSLEYTTTWKIKSSTSSLNLCVPNSPKLQCWNRPRWSRNPVWLMEYTKMVQLENVKRYQPVKNACAVTKFRQLRHFI